MLAVRIIPCLDIAGCNVVKGERFRNLRSVGNAVDFAQRYFLQGADELIFLDVMATVEKREPNYELIQEVARQVFIPLTVGGGITSLHQVEKLLKCGADKVAIGSYLLHNPGFVKEVADNFGSQCLVVSVDAGREADSWYAYYSGGKKNSGKDALDWISEVQELGAGEILLNSIDADGLQQGFDLLLLEKAGSIARIPLIASGGAGSLEHIAEVILKTPVDAVLVASLLHENKLSVEQIKKFLISKGVRIRC